MRALVLATFVFGTTSCVLEPGVEGSFHAEDTRLGTWDLVPDECRSGDRRDFFGADFFEDGTERSVRLVEDPVEGHAVVVSDPVADASLAIRPEDCKKFLVTLEKNGDDEDGVEGVEGHLDLDCRAPEGGVFFGRVDFKECY